MKSDREVRRLQSVYAEYDASAVVRRRRDRFNEGNRLIAVERAVVAQRLLESHRGFPLRDARILDVGCGRGDGLQWYRTLGAAPGNLYGVDLLESRIVEARGRHPEFQFELANAERLPYPDGHFRIVHISTLFSSILDREMARGVAGEVRRVLAGDGLVMWYDFRYRNPRNRHTRPMTRGRIRELFPAFDLRLGTATLLPPLARGLGPLAGRLYPRLAAVPWLRGHYLGVLLPPRA